MKLLTQTYRGIASVMLAIGVVAFAAAAQADPPTRAARLGYIQGPVSFAAAGDDDWVEARLNRPITIGDALWTDNNARAELQLGVASVRLDEYTNMQLLNLDDQTIQLQLTQGRINMRVRSLRRDEVIEVATPNLAFTIRQKGDYRIDVDPSADATTVSVRSGSGEVYGEGSAFTLRGNDAARFHGRDLRSREFYSLAALDDFDRWSSDRDRRGERSVSARYVSPEMIGYSDLDQYGSWSPAEGYGNVWYPREVARDWAPYRYGHWSWIDPWGWTWVDDAPWGFAPFHYGRWATISGRWGWIPGPVNVRPVYAPALVAFVGGSNFRLSISSGPVSGGIGWFPLAPGEVYRPAYAASRDYVRNVNVSNTVVNTTVINNIYNNQTNVTQVNYRNAQVPNAVTAVAPAVFAQSQPVQRGMVTVSQQQVRSAQVTSVAAVAPTPMGILGGAAATNRRPAKEITQREVVARAAPPAPVAPVAQRVDLLQRNPGTPMERSAIVTTTPSPTAPRVRVIGAQTPLAVPTGTQRGASGPPPMTQRSASDVARPAQGAGATSAPAAAPGAPAAAGTPPLQRERGGMGAATAPGTAPSAPAAAPSAAAPPGAPAQPAAREGRPGAASVPPASPPSPAAATPAGSPQSLERNRGMGAAQTPPSAPSGPAAVAPPARTLQSVQPGAGQPSAAPPPPPPPASAPQSVQRERGMGAPAAPPSAAIAPPSAPPQSQPQRGRPDSDNGQGKRPAPASTVAPSAVAPPAPRAAPAVAPRPEMPAPAPMMRQRDGPPSQAAPQAAPQPRPAPPAAAATPAPAPRAAPVAPPQAAPAAPQGGGQQLQGRSRNKDEEDKKK